MKVFIFGLVLSCITLPSMAQTFDFTQKGKNIQFSNASDTVIFPVYKKIDSKTSERVVSINDQNYKFMIRKMRVGRVQEIFDSSGTKLATVFLSGENVNNILFADGNELRWKKSGKTSWAYYKNGKEVVKSFYYKEGEQKKFVVHNYDSTITSVIVPAISLEYGSNTRQVYHSKRTTGTMIGIAAGLAIMRFALTSANDDNP